MEKLKPDLLFIELLTAIKNAEDSSLKETLLHALRCSMIPAGDKMSDTVRHNTTNMVSAMLGHPDDCCRVIAAACLGTLCRILPDDEFEEVAKENLLEDDSSLDWTLRHGRSVALMVALKEAPTRILAGNWMDKIIKVLLTYITADRLAIVLGGVRATGFFMLHLIKNEKPIPQNLLTTFIKSMNHSTNEVKQTVALTINYLSRNATIPLSFQKTVVPHLVNGTKEKNSIVKANSEYALMTLLSLRSGEEAAQACLNVMEAGAREALQDVITKVLKKVASQPEPKEEDLDDTLLT